MSKNLLGQVGVEVVVEAKRMGFKRCSLRGFTVTLDELRDHIERYHPNDRFTIDAFGDVYKFNEPGSNKYNPMEVFMRFFE